MKDTRLSSEIAGPYAKALMSVAEDRSAVDQVGTEVAELLEALASSDELIGFLSNPLTNPEAKKAVLRQISEGRVSDFVLSFLLLLVDRGRIVFMQPILEQFQALLRERSQTVLADVTAAVELSEGQRDAIRDRVKAMTGAHNVELMVTVDPAIIGGLVIKVGSQVIDTSLRGQLRRFALQLTATA